MAAYYSQSRGIASAVGKRFFHHKNKIWNATDPALSSSTPAALIRKGVHTSVYDKNIDDKVRPSVLPDDVIEPQSDKYWAPNPHTGVFGPASAEHTAAAGEQQRTYHTQAADGESGTVLEQQAWFRPLEDIEKPQQN